MYKLLFILIIVQNSTLLNAEENYELLWSSEDSPSMLEIDCFKFTNRIIPNLKSDDIKEPCVRFLTRYHIIPGKTLSLFLTTALLQQNNSLWFYDYLIERTLSTIADKAKSEYESSCQGEYCNALLEQLSSISTRKVHYGSEQEVPLKELFRATELARALLYWFPANIFIGPRNRTDHPGDTFDHNARFIIQNDNVFQELKNINDAMELYIQHRSDWLKFHTAIRMLERFVMNGMTKPYSYDTNQWLKSSSNDNLIQYRIDTNSFIDEPAIDYRANANIFESDPFCVLPLVTMGEVLKKDNLIIAATSIERIRRNHEVRWIHDGSYKSWKHRIQRLTSFNTSFPKETAFTGDFMVRRQYGHIYKDYSFAVGVTSDDRLFGNDSWLQHPQWNITTMCGMIFFDNSGRPVTLAVSDFKSARRQEGWLFVYSNRTWAPVLSTKALLETFPDEDTNSLDTTSIRFNIDDKYWLKFHGREIKMRL